MTTRAEHKRQHVLKIALGIELAGMVLIVLAGVVVALMGSTSGESIQRSSTPARLDSPITDAQYRSVRIGEATRDAVVTVFGGPLATCTVSGCKSRPGVLADPARAVEIGADIPAGTRCVYYNRARSESIFRLCFDTDSGRLRSTSRR
ncbi:MAG: hypothetical protein QOD83_1927 [Solirubrobacteraceae bacterium]|nr:hypothetical protein [Solirubrobacteraceae bacterium]